MPVQIAQFARMACLLCTSPETLLKFDGHCLSLDGSPCTPCSKVAELRSKMEGAQEKLRLKMEVAQEKFRQEMDALIKEYKELLPELNDVHDPICRRLPPEIVSTIFQTCAPSAPFENLNCFESPFIALRRRLSLGAVSRSWRRIAISTPQLWDYLFVRLDPDNISRTAEVLPHWLSRSGSLPLSVSVGCRSNYLPSKEIDGLADMLKHESSRWKTLDIHGPAEFCHLFLGKGEGELVFPMLQSLLLKQWSRSVGEADLGGQVVMPNLVEMKLSFVKWGTFNIQWAFVTRIRLNDMSIDDCLLLLQNAPLIKYCRIADLCPRYNEGPLMRRVIVHGQMESFSISESRVADIDDILHQLSLPALRKLHLECTSERQKLAPGSLASFFRRSSGTLESLWLENIISDTDDLVSALSEVPSLICLYFSAVYCLQGNLSPDIFFKRLSLVSGENGAQGAAFLPRLQELRFRPLQSFSWDLLPPIFGIPHETGFDGPPGRPLKFFSLLWMENENRDPWIPYMDTTTSTKLWSVKETGRLFPPFLTVLGTYTEPVKDLVLSKLEAETSELPKTISKMGCVFCDSPELPSLENPCHLSDESSCITCSKIKELRWRKERITEKFLQAEREMNDVVNEYHRILPHINAAHDSLFRRLPLEVISIIFQFHAPPIPFERLRACDSDINVWAEVNKRLVLGAVCRSWRRAALSTHQLWNYILVRMDSRDLIRDKGIIREWLRRSGRLPLSIHVTCYRSPDTSSKFSDILHLLHRESARWQSLDLCISLEHTARFIGEQSGNVVSPNLQSLKLEPDFRDDSFVGFGRNCVMPKPVDVFLSYVPYKTMEIPWALVTWVNLERPSIEECLDLLRNAPQIKFCKLVELCSRHFGASAITPSSITTHHQIDDLAIDWPDFGALRDFLDLVSFPALKRLRLRAGEDGLSGRPLAAFFRRSRCRLETLVAFDSISDTDDLVAALAEVPSLVELEVSAHSCTEVNLSPVPFFRRLSLIPTENGAQEPVFLPNLQSLEFHPLQAFSWDLLPPIFGLSSQAMVDRPLNRPLRSFHLTCSANVDKDSLPAMDEKMKLALLAVRDAGLRLYISPLHTFMGLPDLRLEGDTSDP
ncbi:hypothetical protein CVT26_011556 [Gymnopilus dilepis]|uniref:F-box domain-containing protein n=1 Tax=Gymnopilus dilepis TaxID=231916 RepID=A0A409W948_9AGAR|nr:hypothetical protein CVT26_011556 [Gymnopilus dilepis]